MKTIVKLFAVLVVLTALNSCKKKNDQAKAKFSIKEKTSTRSMSAKAAPIGEFSFTKAIVGVSKIDFEMQIGDDDQDYKYEGAYRFDVLTGTSTPAIEPVEITPGTYHELEVKIDDVLASGNSIEIEGTYQVGNTSFKFEFSSTMDEDYDIDDPNGVNVGEGDYVTFLLEMDLPSLFAGIDFASANVDADGVIRINDTSNPLLQKIIEDNFDDIMDFDYDED